MTMYLVIRCPGCRTFTYVDRFQHWKLCHVCGEAIDVSRVPVYLDTDDHSDAETIVCQLDTFLKKTGKSDLSSSDLSILRAEYARWVKNHV